jgi:hypothetical protein
VLNICSVALVASSLEQIVHEGTHMLVGVLFGARVVSLSYWGVSLAWEGGAGPQKLAEAVTAGSAAAVNIASATVSAALFARVVQPPFARLLLFYFCVYSLFAGFGYLLVDSLFPSSGSRGDWARVIALAGGTWAVRLPLLAVGAAGTVAGYFWTGRAAARFKLDGTVERSRRLETGVLLCLVPYVVVNSIGTLFALAHPLGLEGFGSAAAKLWLGYLGLFWAFMICFVWRQAPAPGSDATPAPRLARRAWWLAGFLMLAVDVLLLRGFGGRGLEEVTGMIRVTGGVLR